MIAHRLAQLSPLDAAAIGAVIGYDAALGDERAQMALGDILTGTQQPDDAEIGDFFGDLKKVKIPWHDMAKVAKVAGPVVATVFPAAAPAVAAATLVLNAADKGDPKALFSIENLKAAAQAGLPGAGVALQAMEVAKAVQGHAAASNVLAAAATSDVAQAQMSEIKKAADAGDPKAMAAWAALDAAAKGAQLKAQGVIPTTAQVSGDPYVGAIMANTAVRDLADVFGLGASFTSRALMHPAAAARAMAAAVSAPRRALPKSPAAAARAALSRLHRPTAKPAQRRPMGRPLARQQPPPPPDAADDQGYGPQDDGTQYAADDQGYGPGPQDDGSAPDAPMEITDDMLEGGGGGDDFVAGEPLAD